MLIWSACQRTRHAFSTAVSIACSGTPRNRPLTPYRIRLLCLVLACTLISASVNAADYATERQAMVAAIDADARLTGTVTGRPRFSDRVLTALGQVPRHEFVPWAARPFAYENRPLPIGHGQTISQPYIVALMTDLLDLDKQAVVLEIGTGSGYQAAILAELVSRVYTIEIIPELARQAKARLKRLDYNNVELRTGDGYYGWSEQAPFDAIVVTAAASHVPPPLIAQLKAGGKMVIPVGGRFLVQQLLLIEKTAAGETRTRQILPVRFVPLTGGH